MFLGTHPVVDAFVEQGLQVWVFSDQLGRDQRPVGLVADGYWAVAGADDNVADTAMDTVCPEDKLRFDNLARGKCYARCRGVYS